MPESSPALGAVVSAAVVPGTLAHDEARAAFEACAAHPVIILPPLLTCPLCAQAGRRVTYAAQRSQSLEIRRQREAGLLVMRPARLRPAVSAGNQPLEPKES